MIISGDFDRLINLIVINNYEIRSLTSSGNKAFAIKLSDYRYIKKYIKKTNCKVRITKKEGYYFFVKKHIEILFIPLYIACISVIIYYFNLHIYSINITGNMVISSEAILNTLEGAGIHNRILKSEIDYSKIENLILSEYDEISFVSVSNNGTYLDIHIKENHDTLEKIIDNAN